MQKCPICNYSLDAHTVVPGVKQAIPVPGDVSFCFNCNTLLEFNNDLLLVTPSIETLRVLAADENLMRQLNAVRLALNHKPSHN